MKEIKLEGQDAMRTIQCYTMINMLNNVIANGVKEMMDKEYTEEVKKQMNESQFTSLAIATQIQRISEQVSKDFETLTGVKQGESFGLRVEQNPIVIIKEMKKDEV